MSRRSQLHFDLANSVVRCTQLANPAKRASPQLRSYRGCERMLALLRPQISKGIPTVRRSAFLTIARVTGCSNETVWAKCWPANRYNQIRRLTIITFPLGRLVQTLWPFAEQQQFAAQPVGFALLQRQNLID